MRNPIVVVMGVAGCGKTSVGQALARAIGLVFVDGDDLHSPRNVAMMASGRPLQDEDRREWLETIAGRIADAHQRNGLVLACSALKRRYRDVLREGDPATLFVHLSGSRELMIRRLQARRGHFMPASLIDSQFEALEPPDEDEDALTVQAELPVEAIVSLITATLALRST